MMELADRVRSEAREEGLWKAGDTIIVALSGGPDSTALLHLLWMMAREEGITLEAAHVNHGFRAEESAQERQMVEAWCAELGIPLHVAELNLPQYIARTGMNAQAAAREQRYAYLHEAAAASLAQRIALGHHADDQAETVLMRVIRGTGPGGLAGMPVKRKENNVELIRPLLRITKAELIAYCNHYQLPYCIDSSNEKRHYFRNQIRLEVLPYLEQINPRLSGSLLRLADMAREDDNYMEHQTAAIMAEKVKLEPHAAMMDRQSLLELHVALQRRLIKLILNYLVKENDAISYDRIEAIREAAAQGAAAGGNLDAGGGVRFAVDYGVLIWRKDSHQEPSAPYAYPLSADAGSLLIAQTGERLALDVLHQAEQGLPGGPASRAEAWFDLEAVAFPLVVRSRRPGDRMEVLGLNGTKKVQDMFVDAKWPRYKRETAPILCDANGIILWIPDLRRSPHALAGRQTSKVLRIRLEKTPMEQDR
ncbi:tRNA lysidine(34) synthetase TilS [Paenibacillus sp. SYP-B4298]|uniref:tRNA lysidine(34) synthetase TilS n=1 Tax=Paenibacillus sp. SYP-B4298 TaxID=2996034 RepID=UPI0022DE3CA8|nr:tRNA lysidine(34) synthetase TilS [Paenibacillus sp. SYP-B4298]